MGDWDNDKIREITYLKTRLFDMERERNDARKRNQDAQLLVAGAARQGFVNDKQRSALMYSFMALTGESDERLAMLIMTTIQPRGFQLALPKPKEDGSVDYQV